MNNWEFDWCSLTCEWLLITFWSKTCQLYDQAVKITFCKQMQFTKFNILVHILIFHFALFPISCCPDRWSLSKWIYLKHFPLFLSQCSFFLFLHSKWTFQTFSNLIKFLTNFNLNSTDLILVELKHRLNFPVRSQKFNKTIWMTIS